MDPIVEKFFKDREAEERKQVAAGMIRLGICEREYYTCGDPSEYTCVDVDEQTGAVRNYKVVPIELSDEDYELVKPYALAAKEPPEGNLTAKILRIIAFVVYVLGGLGGLVVLFGYGAFSVLLTAFVIGTLILGFSEVIRLHDIKHK